MTLTPIIYEDTCALFHGDSAEIASILPECSVDAIVSDPPSGISFMSKSWDSDRGGRDQWIAWLADLLRPALRALKPGGHALLWALPRTSHWTAMAMELAGFEIRDVHHHLFGSGMPKSLTSASAPIPRETGTALKPAVEHWILGRRPLEGTYGENFAAHGTGVLQIDACRVGSEGGTRALAGAMPNNLNDVYGAGMGGLKVDPSARLGRWPAHLSLEHAPGCRQTGTREDSHVVRVGEKLGADSRDLAFGYGQQATTTTTTTHDVFECAIGCPIRLLDEQSGTVAGAHSETAGDLGFKTGGKGDKPRKTPKSNGGASRFFYCSKPSREEKDEGLEHLEAKTGGEATGRAEGSAGVQNPRAGTGRTGGARNHHPTPKSVALMRWLIRLVTPPGGIVLDVFAGSGTTGVAAIAEGLSFVGVELTDDYVPIIEGRLRHALAEFANKPEP